MNYQACLRVEMLIFDGERVLLKALIHTILMKASHSLLLLILRSLFLGAINRSIPVKVLGLAIF